VNMELKNFGSILNFAVELEAADQAFYKALAANPACAEQKDLFEALGAEAKKNGQVMLRTRRENVTEMILEPIYGFSSESFLADRKGAEKTGPVQAVSMAYELEDKAEGFYTEAAEKMEALREASRALARAAKRRAANKTRLTALSKS
jgi:rubrerythrin